MPDCSTRPLVHILRRVLGGYLSLCLRFFGYVLLDIVFAVRLILTVGFSVGIHQHHG